MDKEVIISLRGTPSDEDAVELVTMGRYYSKDDKYYVTYEESELTGMDGTTTTLELADDKIILVRSGKNNSQLIFEKGKKHLCCYETEYGAFAIGVLAGSVAVDVGESGGEVSARYSLEVGGDHLGINDFYMCIDEKSV